MPKASDLVYVKDISLLFKGPFGFGKTLAAASFALEGPVYLSYWDKKRPVELMEYFTKKRFGAKAEQILDNITYDVYSAENANQYLNKLIDFITDGCPYVAVINDSLTWMTAGTVNWSLNFGKGLKKRDKLKDIIPDFGEYKAETSIVTQALDLTRKLPCYSIWTAHPIPTTKIEGSGASMQVSKINSLVSYGAKVAGIAPGAFSEIYHFTQRSNWSSEAGSSSKQYIVALDALGDEFAKSPLLSNYTKELDITDKLFYEVWKEALSASRKEAAEYTESQTTDSTNSTEQSTTILPPWAR